MGQILAGFLCITVIVQSAHPADAGDVPTSPARLANDAFALLSDLNAQSREGNPNPLLGQVASFASDSETLSKSLAEHDLSAAASALAALQSDRAAINQALKQHPGSLKAQQWKALQGQLEAVAAATRQAEAAQPNPLRVAGSISSPSHHPEAFPIPAESSTPDASEAPGPVIVIASRANEGDFDRIKGFFEGTGLKSAGIYDGTSPLRTFIVNNVVGRQKVEFDLRVEKAWENAVMRVTDTDGRTAEEPLVSASNLEMPSTAEGTSLENGVEVDRSSSGGSETGNTAEIPSLGAARPSPSKRHMLAAKLAGVRINVASVTLTQDVPPAYEIVGEIDGRGITRAGIYVNGKLVQPIPIIASANYTSFDQRLLAKGTPVTIRAYSVGNQFVEQPVDLSMAGNTMANDTAAVVAPAPAVGIAIQVTGIRPAGGGLFLVKGVISGRNIASAALYQNGILAQNLALGGGIGSVIGALLPGSYRSFNFNIRVNPYAGPATIRAFSTDGSYAEQPLVLAGFAPSGTNVYSAGNPYGGLSNSPRNLGNSAPGMPGAGGPLW